jgi:hypothetical protein
MSVVFGVVQLQEGIISLYRVLETVRNLRKHSVILYLIVKVAEWVKRHCQLVEVHAYK